MRVRSAIWNGCRIAATLLAAASALATAAQQQGATADLQFEAASIRLHTASSPSTGRSGIEETPGLIRIEDLSLRALIASAYGIKDARQLAGPAWLGDFSFDIDAKPPSGYKHEQLQPLLRSLLSDRFKLAVHNESKELSGFALVIPKGGHRLREATKPRSFFTARPGLIESTRVSTSELASALARILGRPVIDDTGLTTSFDIKLEWTPDPTPAASDADGNQVAPEPGPSIFTALREQLGLKLNAQKIPVDVVVVDHVEKKPTEN